MLSSHSILKHFQLRNHILFFSLTQTNDESNAIVFFFIMVLLCFLLFLILCVRLKCAAIMWVSNYWFVAYRKRTAHFMHFGLVNAMASISKFTHNLQMDIRKQNVLITITCIGPKLSMNDPPTFALFPTNKRWRVCVCFLFSFSLRVLVGARIFRCDDSMLRNSVLFFFLIVLVVCFVRVFSSGKFSSFVQQCTFSIRCIWHEA